MQGYILTLISAALLVYYYFFVFMPSQTLKNELKTAKRPKDSADAQDDDYVLLMSALTKCKTEAQFDNCLDGIRIFQEKYGKLMTGKIDTTALIDFYLEKKNKVLQLQLV